MLAKEAKKRKEAATAYRDANRPELAEKEEAELAILETYLPRSWATTRWRSWYGEPSPRPARPAWPRWAWS